MSDKLLVDGPGIWAFQVPLQKNKKVRIGRAAENEVKLTDAQVSMRHAEIFWADVQWVIQDLKSTNGTLLNGKPISDSGLRSGDTIKIGSTEIVFQSPEDTGDDNAWNRTQMFAAKQAHAIQSAIERAKDSSVVEIPDFASVPTLPAARTGTRPEASAPLPPPKAPPRSFSPPQPSAPPPPEYLPPPRRMKEPTLKDFVFDSPLPPTPTHTLDHLTPDDSLWVAEQLAAILSELAAHRKMGKQDIFQQVLKRLRAAINAENGFLMIPDTGRRRWVIRSWVGDQKQWTAYEKEHPVSLTVANKAFKEDKLVSNALQDPDHSPDPSESMLMLQVVSYVGVPLHCKGEKAGLLYFDTRRTSKMFLLREIKLLEEIGGYLLQIDKEM